MILNRVAVFDKNAIRVRGVRPEIGFSHPGTLIEANRKFTLS